MARANRIYVVKERYSEDGNIAAFTVKKECIEWIKKNISDYLCANGTWFEVNTFNTEGKKTGIFEIKDVVEGKRLI